MTDEHEHTGGDECPGCQANKERRIDELVKQSGMSRADAMYVNDLAMHAATESINKIKAVTDTGQPIHQGTVYWLAVQMVIVNLEMMLSDKLRDQMLAQLVGQMGRTH